MNRYTPNTAARGSGSFPFLFCLFSCAEPICVIYLTNWLHCWFYMLNHPKSTPQQLGPQTFTIGPNIGVTGQATGKQALKCFQRKKPGRLGPCFYVMLWCIGFPWRNSTGTVYKKQQHPKQIKAGCCWEEMCTIYGILCCQATTYIKGLTVLFMTVLMVSPRLGSQNILYSLYTTLSHPPLIPYMPDISLEQIIFVLDIRSLLTYSSSTQLSWTPICLWNHATFSKDNETISNFS